MTRVPALLPLPIDEFLPQVVAAPVAGIILDFGQQVGPGRGYPNLGYTLIFSMALLFFVLGTVFVSRIRGVR